MRGADRGRRRWPPRTGWAGVHAVRSGIGTSRVDRRRGELRRAGGRRGVEARQAAAPDRPGGRPVELAAAEHTAAQLGSQPRCAGDRHGCCAGEVARRRSGPVRRAVGRLDSRVACCRPPRHLRHLAVAGARRSSRFGEADATIAATTTVAAARRRTPHGRSTRRRIDRAGGDSATQRPARGPPTAGGGRRHRSVGPAHHRPIPTTDIDPVVALAAGRICPARVVTEATTAARCRGPQRRAASDDRVTIRTPVGRRRIPGLRAAAGTGGRRSERIATTAVRRGGDDAHRRGEGRRLGGGVVRAGVGVGRPNDLGVGARRVGRRGATIDRASRRRRATGRRGGRTARRTGAPRRGGRRSGPRRGRARGRRLGAMTFVAPDAHLGGLQPPGDGTRAGERAARGGGAAAGGAGQAAAHGFLGRRSPMAAVHPGDGRHARVRGDDGAQRILGLARQRPDPLGKADHVERRAGPRQGVAPHAAADADDPTERAGPPGDDAEPAPDQRRAGHQGAHAEGHRSPDDGAVVSWRGTHGGRSPAPRPPPTWNPRRTTGPSSGWASRRRRSTIAGG